MKKQVNKKIALLLTALVCMLSARAQFLGIRASNFGGITNVNYNPAIADSRYLVDINLFTMDMTSSNNYIGMKGKLSSFKDFDDEINLKENLNGKKKFAYVSSTNQLPLSFLVSFGKDKKNNQAIAFSSHLNSVTNVDNMGEALARNLRWGWGNDAFTKIGNFVGVNNSLQDVGVKGMIWADAGLTYSRVVLDKDKHFLKLVLR